MDTTCRDLGAPSRPRSQPPASEVLAPLAGGVPGLGGLSRGRDSLARSPTSPERAAGLRRHVWAGASAVGAFAVRGLPVGREAG